MLTPAPSRTELMDSPKPRRLSPALARRSAESMARSAPGVMRDLSRDWQGWSAAERVGAVCILGAMAMLAEIVVSGLPLGL